MEAAAPKVIAKIQGGVGWELKASGTHADGSCLLWGMCVFKKNPSICPVFAGHVYA